MGGQHVIKAELRKNLRAARREHVAALHEGTRALLFRRPPAPVIEMIPNGGVIGLYHATPEEAPTVSYARWMFEEGHRIALPRFAAREAPMEFAVHSDPFEESDLVEGPFGIRQPGRDAQEVTPQAVFVPLLGFTEGGLRLGQGAGHYDRWFADHPEVLRIGLAWDVQHLDELPTEPHDIALHAVITPTRFYPVSVS